MTDIYDKDFNTVTKYFYILDNILKLRNKRMSDHLNKVNLSSSFFSSSWIITLFTNALQYNRKSSLCKIIFDLYLIDDIKAIFKSIIMILEYY